MFSQELMSTLSLGRGWGNNRTSSLTRVIVYQVGPLPFMQLTHVWFSASHMVPWAEVQSME